MFKKTEQQVPERLEELDKLNEAHCAVRYHEVLKALETALPTTVPRPAAPRPDNETTVNSQYLRLAEPKGSDLHRSSDFCKLVPRLCLGSSREGGRGLGPGLVGPGHAGGGGRRGGAGSRQPGDFIGGEGERSGEAVLCDGTSEQQSGRGCRFSGTTVQL